MQRRSFTASFVFLFFALFFLYPISTVFIRAFFFEGKATTANFELFFLDSQAIPALLKSCLLAFTVGILSVVIGLLSGIVLSRYTFRGRGLLEILCIAPFFLPPFVGVVGMKSIFGRFGTVNISLQHIGALATPIDFFKPGTIWGIVLLQVLHLYPLVYLGVRTSLQKIPMELLEAGMLSGANAVKRFTRIILPLCIPSALSGGLLACIGSLTDVGTPLLFEWRQFAAVQIFSSVIDLPKQGSGYALTLFIAVFVVLLFLIAYKIENRYPTAFDPKLTRIIPLLSVTKAWERSAIFLISLVAFLGIVPHVSLLLVSFSKYWFMTALPDTYSAHSYSEVFQHPLTSHSFLYSLGLSIAAAILSVGLGFIIAQGSLRSGFLNQVNNTISLLPLAIPGIVLAFGLAVGFAGTVLDPKDNPTVLLIIAYTVRKLPYAVRFCRTSILQVPKSLIEIATISGAKFLSIVKRILFPLHRPAIVSIGVVVFLSSMIEVSDSLLLPLDEKYFPIAKTLYALQGRPDGASIAAAFSVVVMAIVMVGFLIVAKIQRKKVGELLRGA